MKTPILLVVLIMCLAHNNIYAISPNSPETACWLDTLGDNTVAAGLKQTLVIGIERGANKLAITDGYFKNAAVKILLPPEAQNVEKTLRNIGMGRLVDSAVLSMNRAAELAAKSAAPIFVSVVKDISLQDALNILGGSDTAATTYLRSKTTVQLTQLFLPLVQGALEAVKATKLWNEVVTVYNKVPLAKKLNPDLSEYVTDRTISGIFYQVGQEETLIRKNPAARSTELLQSVFGKR